MEKMVTRTRFSFPLYVSCQFCYYQKWTDYDDIS